MLARWNVELSTGCGYMKIWIYQGNILLIDNNKLSSVVDYSWIIVI